MIILHHNVKFQIDTSDWADEKSRLIAENALISGIEALSAEQVKIISDSWVSDEAECESRNSNDTAARIIESIERTARIKALKKWDKKPDLGHNCFISIQINSDKHATILENLLADHS